MTPIIPHFANECLTTIKAKDIKWPDYDTSMLKEDTINVVIQINGKKEDLSKQNQILMKKNSLK